MLVGDNNNIDCKIFAGVDGESAAEADNPRKILRDAWIAHIAGMADWVTMLTLTVSDEHMCYREGMERRIKYLVQRLNVELYGNHYPRKVGHGYFSYVAGFEMQKREVIHAHMIVNQLVHFELIKSLWRCMSGGVFFTPVTTQDGAVSYVTKYAIKEGDLMIYKSSVAVMPYPKIKNVWYDKLLVDTLSKRTF